MVLEGCNCETRSGVLANSGFMFCILERFWQSVQSPEGRGAIKFIPGPTKVTHPYSLCLCGYAIEELTAWCLHM